MENCKKCETYKLKIKLHEEAQSLSNILLESYEKLLIKNLSKYIDEMYSKNVIDDKTTFKDLVQLYKFYGEPEAAA